MCRIRIAFTHSLHSPLSLVSIPLHSTLSQNFEMFERRPRLPRLADGDGIGEGTPSLAACARPDAEDVKREGEGSVEKRDEESAKAARVD